MHVQNGCDDTEIALKLAFCNDVSAIKPLIAQRWRQHWHLPNQSAYVLAQRKAAEAICTDVQPWENLFDVSLTSFTQHTAASCKRRIDMTFT